MNSKKLFAGAVALAMAAAIVPSAGQAATAEELAAQIAQLQAQLASLICFLYTSDAADDLLCVDLGCGRIIKKKSNNTDQQLHYY